MLTRKRSPGRGEEGGNLKKEEAHKKPKRPNNHFPFLPACLHLLMRITTHFRPGFGSRRRKLSRNFVQGSGWSRSAEPTRFASGPRSCRFRQLQRIFSFKNKNMEITSRTCSMTCTVLRSVVTIYFVQVFRFSDAWFKILRP